MATYYRHSGTAPIGGIVQMGFAGLATASTLAIVYSYGVVWIPLVYVNFALTCAFGYLIGLMISRAARGGHVRNVMIPTALGFGCGLVGLYIAWGVDFRARVEWPAGESVMTAFYPLPLLGYIQAFYEEGAWGLGKNGGNISGIPLAIVWLVEASLIVGLATYAAYTGVQELAYCEECGRWTQHEPNIRQLAADRLDEDLAQIAEGDVRPLGQWLLAPSAALRFVQVSLRTCDQCDASNYLTLDLAEVKVDKNNERSVTTTTRVDKLAISAEDVEFVRNAGVAPPTEAEAEADLAAAVAQADPSAEDDFLKQISAKK